MRKNKNQAAERARTRRAQKQKARQRTPQPKPLKYTVKNRLSHMKVQRERVTNAIQEHMTPIYDRWLAHGANYIASSYEEGTWEPLFNIYDGEPVPSKEGMLAEVNNLINAPTGSTQETLGRAILSWMLLPLHAHYSLVMEGRRRLGVDTDDALMSPHSTGIWELMNEVKQHLMGQP